MSTPQPSRDDTREVSGIQEIARRAYEIWDRGGRKDGTALSDWLQAEEESRRDPDNAAIPTEPGLIAREKIAGDAVRESDHSNQQPVTHSSWQQRRSS
jgi:hypothetical protein